MRFCGINDAGNTSHEFENKLRKAYAYLKFSDFSNLSEGRHDVCADFYIVVSRTATVPKSAVPYEAHRRYADIHYVLKGSETVLVSDINDMRPLAEYDEKGDTQLFDEPEKCSKLRISAGQLAVLMPHDAHKSGLHEDVCESGIVEKIVVKVRI